MVTLACCSRPSASTSSRCSICESCKMTSSRCCNLWSSLSIKTKISQRCSNCSSSRNHHRISWTILNSSITSHNSTTISSMEEGIKTITSSSSINSPIKKMGITNLQMSLRLSQIIALLRTSMTIVNPNPSLLNTPSLSRRPNSWNALAASSD